MTAPLKQPGVPAATASRFVAGLLRWNDSENDRLMPWKGETDPYRIWLSEIILQQTRVEVGRAYYERFLAAFPTVGHLARAPEQSVFKLWEGLGYYARCRNLIAAARTIAEERSGVFPTDYESILALKGVGPYTAAAIASFAYNLPHAVLDGNVYRVLARIFGIDIAIDSAAGKKFFTEIAARLLPGNRAGEYNQAIMDFGATVCKPLPACVSCFFSQQCAAFRQGRQALLPVKGKKTVVRERWFHYLLLEHDGSLALRQRTGPDIWQGLYEPVLIEAAHTLPQNTLLSHLESELGISSASCTVMSSEQTTQKLTHQTIHFTIVHLHVRNRTAVPGYTWVSPTDLPTHPFPRTLQRFLFK